jgi:hypothetical protein
MSRMVKVSQTGSNKKYVKLSLAIDKLVSQGTFKKEMNIDDLEVGKDYAVVVDFTSEEGSPVPESRQALKVQKIQRN